MERVTFRNVARGYLASIAVWCALSLLTGWQYRIFDGELNIHSTLLDMLLLAEARGFAFALLTPPIFYLVRRFLDNPNRSMWSYSAFCLGVVPFTLLYAGIHWIILPPWDAVAQRYVPRAGHTPFELIRSGFADQITMYIAIVVAAHAYRYFDRLRNQEVERADFQRALAASELQLLKMQIHPHFLFNTLHGIATLIDSDRSCAKAMIIKLSTLLRTALECGSSDLIPLRDEIGFIGEYLDLELMRFGARLRIEWAIPRETLDVLVPQMILQPLVENAIRHGIGSSRGGGWIEVSSHVLGRRVQLQVKNSVGTIQSSGTGVGFRNTEARLKHLYSNEARLSFKLQGRTAITILEFPALGSPLSQSAPAHSGETNRYSREGDQCVY